MEAPSMKGRPDDPSQQCGSCHQIIGDDLAPHTLECKHRVCLKCVRDLEDKGTRSIYCSYCWHQSEINDPLLSNNSTNPSSPFGHNLVDLCNSLNTLSVAFASEYGPLSKNGAGSPVLSDSTSTGSDSSTGGLGIGQSRSKAECLIHHSPQTMFCVTCNYAICYMCACNSHNPATGHTVRPNQEMTDHTISELHSEIANLRKLNTETRAMQVKQREFTLKVLEACSTLEKQMVDRLAVQDESFSAERQDSTQYLINKTLFQLPTINGNEEANDLLMSLKKEKIRLQNHHHELSVQCALEEMVSSSVTVFDFQTFKQSLHSLRHRRNNVLSSQHHSFSDPISFLANYCSSRVYSKHLFNAAIGNSENIHSLQNYTGNPMAQAGRLVNNSPYPRFFMDVEVNGVMEGRVVFEVRPDVAPKMSKNFGALCTGEKGYGYKGCQVFQCWGGESCIAGDFECNSGRGGRSSFDEPFFLPDDSKLPCVRGTIGMRRTQKRHNNLGLVGSQFRIILREMPFFTGVFGKVVIGIEVIEKISFLGDQQGFPRQVITVSNCGVFA